MSSALRALNALAVIVPLLMTSGYAPGLAGSGAYATSGAWPNLASPGETSLATGSTHGLTWVSRSSGTVNRLRRVTCTTSSTCLIVGDGGTILASADGGATWSNRSTSAGQDLRGITCPSTSDCLAVGSWGTILVSTDGGATWSRRPSGVPYNLFDITCPTSRGCVAVGDGAILTSTDAGATWTDQLPRPLYTSTIRTGVACPSRTHCLAVGQYGMILASADGGATWSNRSTSAGQDLRGITCPSTSDCLAVGSWGTILASTNGGLTWSSRFSGTKDDLDSVACATIKTCVTVGGGSVAGGPVSTILTSTDGGGTWRNVSPNASNELWGITCPTSTSCLAVGDNGTILQGQLPTSSPDQQHLAKAIGQYKTVLDIAFGQLTGTVGDLGTEGQSFRDEVKSDQFRVYASIARAAIDTLVGGWNELDGKSATDTEAKLIAVCSDFSLGFAKGATIDAMAKKLVAYLHDHSVKDQAATMASGIDRSIRAGIDKQLDALIANPPNLSKAKTDAVIAALRSREDALAWIGTRQVLGAAATLHEAFYQQGSSHVGADLVTALWQQATPLLLSALFGPEAGVGAGALISVWNTAVAQQKLAADAQVVAEYELALLSMQDYTGRLHDAATLVIKGLKARPVAFAGVSAMVANVQVVGSGAAATRAHRTDTRREVLNLTIHNTGATMPFYVLVTYNTGFDINGTLTLGGQQKLHLSVLATLDSFQLGGKGQMIATITVLGKATSSVSFTLQDAATHLDLVPGKGEQIHIALLPEPTLGDFVLADSKQVPNDQAIHFQYQQPVTHLRRFVSPRNSVIIVYIQWIESGGDIPNGQMLVTNTTYGVRCVWRFSGIDKNGTVSLTVPGGRGPDVTCNSPGGAVTGSFHGAALQIRLLETLKPYVKRTGAVEVTLHPGTLQDYHAEGGI